MAIEMSYFLDSDGIPCIKVINDGVEMLSEKVSYPYTNIPAQDLAVLVDDLRLMYTDAIQTAMSADDNAIYYTSAKVADIGNKLSQLIVILKARDGYIP